MGLDLHLLVDCFIEIGDGVVEVETLLHVTVGMAEGNRGDHIPSTYLGRSAVRTSRKELGEI